MIYIFNKEKLDYEKPSKVFFLKCSILLLVAVLNLSYAVSKFIYKDIILKEEAETIVMRENNEFSKDKLKQYLLELNI